MNPTKATLIVTLLLGAHVVKVEAQTKSSTKQNPIAEAQLRVAFARMDLNHDAFLDAAELAKAFRGPKAAPPPPLEFDDTGNPKPGTGFDRKYGDQVYLYALDKDFDGKISWPEFDEYGEAQYGQQLNPQKQQTLYRQAQRNVVSSRSRRGTYSRSGSNRYAYHRSVQQPQSYATNYARSVQIQQARVMQTQQQQRVILVRQQQQRMILLQQQQQRLQVARLHASYARSRAPAHRVVRTPARTQRRR
jgi:hypothetical protein